MSWWHDRYTSYPRARPREAQGGIKAHSKRGQFGESWWAKRWIAVLEGFDIGRRLGRGRSYARKGQVLGIEIEKGKVHAKVQGSRPQPYDVMVKVTGIPPEDWRRLVRALSRQAIFAAKLLAGEMPQDIEEVFRTEKLSLFPEALLDLTTKCSCPDWSNPCKHIAAVYYLLGEEFDRDPVLLFTLRGLERAELLEQLTDAGAAKARAEPAPTADAATPSEALPVDPAAFWQAGALPDHFFGEVKPPPVAAPLLRRLGGFPFWRGEEPFFESLAPVYSAATPRGLDAFLGKNDVPSENAAEKSP
jgi:uncharacterized Zn finger protein